MFNKVHWFLIYLVIAYNFNIVWGGQVQSKLLIQNCQPGDIA